MTNNILEHVCKECTNNEADYITREKASEKTQESDYFSFSGERFYEGLFEDNGYKVFGGFHTKLKRKYKVKKIRKFFRTEKDLSEDDWQDVIYVISVLAIQEWVGSRSLKAAKRAYTDIATNVSNIHSVKRIPLGLPLSISTMVKNRSVKMASKKKGTVDADLQSTISYAKSKNLDDKSILNLLSDKFDSLKTFHSKRIARTETTDMVNIAAFNAYARYKVPMAKIVTSPTACPICVGLAHGNPYELGSVPIPGFHPWCVCFIEPIF